MEEEMSVFVSSKIPKELYAVLQEYKWKRAISTDSEAVRGILRNYLLGSGSSSPSSNKEVKEER